MLPLSKMAPWTRTEAACGGWQDWIEPPLVHVVPDTLHDRVTPHFGGRLRFADVDLTRLRPWCDQSDRQCCRMPSGSARNCHLHSGTCCSATCTVGGVDQCSGHHCSSAGPASQCCGGHILSAGVACNVGITNAPCVLNQYPGTDGGSKVLCSQDCYDASLGKPRCGGSGCSRLPGGASQCCVSTIRSSGKLCGGDALEAPCVLP